MMWTRSLILTGSVIVDNYSVGSTSPISLSDTETFVDMCASNGGIVLFVTEEGKLIAKTLTFGKTTSVQNNDLVEEFGNQLLVGKVG